MKLKKHVVGILIAASLATPAMSNAATEAEALQACVRAMVDRIDNANGAPVKVTIDAGSDNSTRKLRQHSVFHIDAADKKTGELVARIDCYIDKYARVKYLRQLSLSARKAPRRATDLG